VWKAAHRSFNADDAVRSLRCGGERHGVVGVLCHVQEETDWGGVVGRGSAQENRRTPEIQRFCLTG